MHEDKTVKELRSLLDAGEVTSKELTEDFIDQIEKKDDELGAFLTVTKEEALEAAQNYDKSPTEGLLSGIPYALKDNICTEGIKTTAASKILGNFIPPYDATVYEKLKDQSGVLLGKLNLDEFAMGSSTENSAYQPTKNPWDTERVPGGSSGGSAVAVAAGMAPFALGSDTGGSIRQPAAFNGLVGFKPTYGMVSRYGLIAFASSLDQIGSFTHTVEDAALVLSQIMGKDKRDSTSLDIAVPELVENLNNPIEGKKIAVVPSILEGTSPDIRERYEEALKVYKDLGAEIVEVDFNLLEEALSAYYIIASAEASSNLARYDGVRYGVRAEDYDGLVDMYVQTRTAGFGDEVKRRIMLGTYALSSGYYDAFYKKAMQMRTLILEEYNKIFDQADVMLTPTTATTAFKFGERLADPLSMYLSDLYTIPANIAGLPALSMPGGLDSQGLPIGLQLTGKALSEDTLLNFANLYEKETGYENLRA